MEIIVEVDQCRGCGGCVKICPANALSIVDGGAVLDPSRCNLDGICIPACPYDAIGYFEDEVGGCGF